MASGLHEFPDRLWLCVRAMKGHVFIAVVGRSAGPRELLMVLLSLIVVCVGPLQRPGPHAPQKSSAGFGLASAASSSCQRTTRWGLR